MNASTLFKSVCLAAVLGLGACELPNEPVTQSATEMTGDFSSGETLEVLVTLNNGEIQQAELARKQSRNPQVQQLAQAIIEDHKKANQRIDSLAAEGVELEKSPLSRGLKLQAGEIRENLAEMSGSEFDCTYLQKQIEQHELALDAVRSDIKPTTEARQVQQLLSQVEPALERHLTHARNLHERLPNCPTG